MPPQPLCLAILPVNPKASSPFPCPRLSFPSARHLPLVLPKGSRKATIPFRIIFFADTHHLTPMESYSYKYRGRGWGHSLPACECLSLRSKIGIPSIGSEGPLRSPDEEICPDERSEEGPFPKSDEGFLSRTADGNGEVLLGRFVNYSASKHGRMTFATRQTLAAEATSWGDCVVKL